MFFGERLGKELEATSAKYAETQMVLLHAKRTERAREFGNLMDKIGREFEDAK